MPRPRVAVVVEDREWLDDVRDWIGDSLDLAAIDRGRHLAADLAAAKPSLLIVETVHPSEAGWLLGWVHAQPRLARLPVIMLLPFGPAPCPNRPLVSFLEKPVTRESLTLQIERLLGPRSCGTPPPSQRR